MNNYPNLAPFSIAGQDLSQQAAPAPAAPSGFDPKMLAKLLSSPKGNDDTQTEYVDGWAVQKNPMAGIGGILGNLASTYMAGQK